MILNKENLPYQKKQIDITGPDGNAFVLLSYAKQLSKDLELNVDEILNEMKEKDYQHLIEIFDKHFGNYVDLVK